MAIVWHGIKGWGNEPRREIRKQKKRQGGKLENATTRAFDTAREQHQRFSHPDMRVLHQTTTEIDGYLPDEAVDVSGKRTNPAGIAFAGVKESMQYRVDDNDPTYMIGNHEVAIYNHASDSGTESEDGFHDIQKIEVTRDPEIVALCKEKIKGFEQRIYQQYVESARSDLEELKKTAGLKVLEDKIQHARTKDIQFIEAADSKAAEQKKKDEEFLRVEDEKAALKLKYAIKSLANADKKHTEQRTTARQFMNSLTEAQRQDLQERGDATRNLKVRATTFAPTLKAQWEARLARPPVITNAQKLERGIKSEALLFENSNSYKENTNYLAQKKIVDEAIYVGSRLTKNPDGKRARQRISIIHKIDKPYQDAQFRIDAHESYKLDKNYEDAVARLQENKYGDRSTKAYQDALKKMKEGQEELRKKQREAREKYDKEIKDLHDQFPGTDYTQEILIALQWKEGGYGKNQDYARRLRGAIRGLDENKEKTLTNENDIKETLAKMEHVRAKALLGLSDTTTPEELARHAFGLPKDATDSDLAKVAFALPNTATDFDIARSALNLLATDRPHEIKRAALGLATNAPTLDVLKVGAGLSHTATNADLYEHFALPVRAGIAPTRELLEHLEQHLGLPKGVQADGTNLANRVDLITDAIAAPKIAALIKKSATPEATAVANRVNTLIGAAITTTPADARITAGNITLAGTPYTDHIDAIKGYIEGTLRNKKITHKDQDVLTNALQDIQFSHQLTDNEKKEFGLLDGKLQRLYKDREGYLKDAVEANGKYLRYAMGHYSAVIHYRDMLNNLKDETLPELQRELSESHHDMHEAKEEMDRYYSDSRVPISKRAEADATSLEAYKRSYDAKIAALDAANRWSTTNDPVVDDPLNNALRDQAHREASDDAKTALDTYVDQSVATPGVLRVEAADEYFRARLRYENTKSHHSLMESKIAETKIKIEGVEARYKYAKEKDDADDLNEINKVKAIEAADIARIAYLRNVKLENIKGMEARRTELEKHVFALQLEMFKNDFRLDNMQVQQRILEQQYSRAFAGNFAGNMMNGIQAPLNQAGQGQVNNMLTLGQKI